MSEADNGSSAEVAARVKSESGLNDEQLEALLGLGPSTWDSYTKGVEVPTVKLVEKISDLLGYWPAVLLDHFGYVAEAAAAEAIPPTAAMEQRIATASRKRRERMRATRPAVCSGGEADGTELDIQWPEGTRVDVTGATGTSLPYRVTSKLHQGRVVLEWIEAPQPTPDN